MSDLLSEIEIMNRVEGDWGNPAVTFLCTTYNQEDYIEQTIIGFLKQKTSFPYEILIHDDASSDNTQDIIESYRLKYPHIIKCVYQTENKLSQGIYPSSIIIKQCKSDYVALCEGDDYWINENKIENQYNFILNDNSISMVVSPGKIEQNSRILPELHCYYGDEIRSFTAQEILNISGQFAPTASYILKKEYYQQAKEFFKKAPIGDLFIELYCAVYGKVVYYPEIGSVYRRAAKNSWTERMASDKSERIKFIDTLQQAIDNSRKIKGFKDLDWSVKLATLYHRLAHSQLQDKDFEGFSKAIEKSRSFGHMTRNKRILYYSRGYMPWLYRFIKPVNSVRKRLKRI